MKLKLPFYKSLCLLSCIFFVLPFAATSQTTVSIYSTGPVGSYNTGSVNVSGVKFDGNIDSVSIGNTLPYATAFRGWAAFDLSTVPVGATITSATLYFTTYNGSTSSGAVNTISGFLGSPSTMTGATLYNDIGTGTVINSSSWTANGLQTQPLNAAGITFLQTNAGSPVNVGFMRAGYLAYHIYGYPATATADRPRLDITYTVSNQCATISSVTATGPSTICTGVSFTLASATFPAAAGFTFQWESSPAGMNTWTAMSGATTSTYSVTQSYATDYRVVVTCPTTSAQGTSNIVSVAQSNFNTCYCPGTVGYVLNDDITNVLIGSINNTSACASLVGSQGTASGGADIYSDFTTSLVPVPSLMQGNTEMLSVTMSSCGAASTTRECKAYIDYDQNGLFTDPGEEIIVYPFGNPNSSAYTATVSFTVPGTALLGNTRMRIILGQGQGSIASPCGVLLSYGEVEDYTVNIVASVPCGGQPTAGVASGPASVCSGIGYSLNLAMGSVGTGLVIQWESSPAGTNTWTAIPGATAASYGVPLGQTAATDYRAMVTCTNGGLFDYSNTVAVAMSPLYLCYCSPNNGISLNGTNTFNYLTGVAIPTTTLNNPNTLGGYNLYYPTTGTTTGDIAQLMQYTLNTTHTSTGYTSVAWIDYDASGTFDASEYMPLTAAGSGATATFTVPVSAVPGLTGLRIRTYFTTIAATDACSVNGSYETEDYVVNILATSGCLGTPVAGTASGPANACAAVPFNLTLLGYTIGQGITFVWESSPSGQNIWVPMAGQTSAMATAITQTASTDYRVIVTCNGALSATSNTVTVLQNPPGQCYCTPLYTTGCTSNDNIHTFTLTGENSTAFNDLNTGCSPNAYDDRTAQPAVQLAQSLTYNGTVNSLYTFPSEYVKIWIDFGDDGVFDPTDVVGLVSNISTPLSPYTITIPATATIGSHRMRVRMVFGGTAAVIDPCTSTGYGETHDYTVSVIAAPLCLAPTGLTSTNVTTATADVSWNPAASAVSYDWAVDQTNTPAPGGATIITNNNATFQTATGLSAGTTYYLHVRTNCGVNGTSSWTVYSFSTPPANDPCANSINLVNNITLNATTAGATQSQPGCDATLVANDVWYSFTTGSVGGPVTVTAITTGTMDVVMEAFTGSCGAFTSLNPTSSSTPGTASCIDGPAAGTEFGVYNTFPFTTYYVRVYGFNSAQGAFTISAAGTPLSIKLLSINAVNAGSRNRIDWTTGEEMKSDYMLLQRSADGANYTDLSRIEAKGTPSAYSYWDEKPVTGLNHYRLKMVDAAGTFSYSQVVTATVKGGAFTVEAYPNPVSEVLTVKVYGNAAANATVTVTDVTGKAVRVVSVENNQASIKMGSLAHGTYLVKYSDSEHTQVIKVNKQ